MFIHSDPLFLYLKNCIWHFIQKANYLESLFWKFIKVQQIFNSSCTLENSDCLWSGCINKTWASNVPLGDKTVSGIVRIRCSSSPYTGTANVPDVSQYCGSSPSLSEAGIHWKQLLPEGDLKAVGRAGLIQFLIQILIHFFFNPMFSFNINS